MRRFFILTGTFIAAFIVLGSFVTIAAQGQAKGGRYALVIGSSHYTDLASLKNPGNDATDMAAALRGLGFEVNLLLDADLIQMENAVARLGTQLSAAPSSIGFFYYAGHGVQSNGVNYLIPADARILNEAYLKTKALAAQSVLDVLQGAGNSLNVVVLDACRDNPFGWARSGMRGLSVVSSQPPGSIVVFATSAGSTAQDGSGRNGVFTSELLKNIAVPGLEIKDVFNRTGAGVQEATVGKQTPAVYNQFFGSAYLAGAGGSVSAVSEKQPASIPQPQAIIPIQSTGETAEMVVMADRDGAEVFVDGTKLGIAPNLFSGVPAGREILVEVRQGNYVAKQTVTLKAGETRELSFQLEREKGRLYIKVANPGSYTLILDGERQGKLSASGLVNSVDAGNLDVELIGDGLYWKGRVSVKAGSETTIVTATPWVDEVKAPKDFVLVEGGSFTMGSNSGDSDGKPVHQVTVSSFLIGKFEVTQEQYQAVIGTNPSFFSSGSEAPKRPVEQVSWYDAVNFCNKLSEMEGLQKVYTINGTDVRADFSRNGYRLPTEAEWEYAARGGASSKNYKYAGSNDVGQVAWYGDNSGRMTHAVGTKAPNGLGLYDMSGNVFEWCWDWYGRYRSNQQTDPAGSSSGTSRVRRGGCWYNEAVILRVASRGDSTLSSRYSNLGFRVVRCP